MTKFRKYVAQIGCASVIAAGALLASTSSASAETACNRYGDCWHVDHRDHYPNTLGVRFYSDDWYRHHDWDHDRRLHWRANHDGRGYWRNGIWIQL